MGVKRLKSLGLVEGQLLQPEVGIGCANETTAEVVGIFFGKVTTMEGDRKIKVRVMFYVLKNGGDLLSRHTCERLGVIDAEFPKVGKHLHEVCNVEAGAREKLQRHDGHHSTQLDEIWIMKLAANS